MKSRVLDLQLFMHVTDRCLICLFKSLFYTFNTGELFGIVFGKSLKHWAMQCFT